MIFVANFELSTLENEGNAPIDADSYYFANFNSFSSAAEITRAISTWYFACSYLRFSACYVDENNTIRFSEKFPIDTYNKMSTL
jgi:hypothetical protein